jgi:branched-chain amino acid transport system ATP-binding protein
VSVLTTKDIVAGYETANVLQGVSIAVEPGEIVAVVGRNGVGKTTLMQTAIGMLAPRAGQVLFEGEDISAERADLRARRGIGYVPQGRGIFPHLTVRENLAMGRFIAGPGGEGGAREEEIFGYFPILKERLAQRGGTLSGGQQAMLAIARALIGEPRLLLLDEPSDGVQPSIIHEIGELIRALNKDRGLTVLLVEQNIDLMQTAERAYVLDKGKVIAEVDGETLSDTDRIARFLAV